MPAPRVASPDAATTTPGDTMTIDELARRAGCTTRNIRNHQTAGLLPPPTLVGRVGRYDDGHLARLRLITQLQDQGYSLAGIASLLQAWEQGHSLADVLGFEKALTAPWTDEEPEVVSPAALFELFPESATRPDLILRAVELGLISPEGPDVLVHSPRLVRTGAELVAVGVPLAATLEELGRLRQDLDRVAGRLVQLFEDHVWTPFADAGMPADQLPHVTDALRRMRPLAAATVDAVLAQAMEHRTAASTAMAAIREGMR
ncbi:MAG TPA: MerR family transcriptional regulator [Acidimicrobiales bacterium]|nr:MerR family transcriptional regulator [Acidimicrobiales bacterium]